MAAARVAPFDPQMGDQVDGGPVGGQGHFDQVVRSLIHLPKGVKEAMLQLEVLPKKPGMKINAEAPNKVVAALDGVQIAAISNFSPEAWNEVAVRDFGAAFSLSLRLFLCDAAAGTCAVQSVRLDILIERQQEMKDVAEKAERIPVQVYVE